MPRTKWSELSAMQLGQYGEYYAKMEFTSYGFDVYTSEVEDTALISWPRAGTGLSTKFR